MRIKATTPRPRRTRGSASLPRFFDCIFVRFVREAAIPPEGYRLEVASNGVTVASADDAGAFYARKTLKQLAEVGGGALRTARPTNVVPCCSGRRGDYRGNGQPYGPYFYTASDVRCSLATAYSFNPLAGMMESNVEFGIMRTRNTINRFWNGHCRRMMAGDKCYEN